MLINYLLWYLSEVPQFMSKCNLCTMVHTSRSRVHFLLKGIRNRLLWAVKMTMLTRNRAFSTRMFNKTADIKPFSAHNRGTYSDHHSLPLCTNRISISYCSIVCVCLITVFVFSRDLVHFRPQVHFSTGLIWSSSLLYQSLVN